jgi:hypothetical protein
MMKQQLCLSPIKYNKTLNWLTINKFWKQTPDTIVLDNTQNQEK